MPEATAQRGGTGKAVGAARPLWTCPRCGHRFVTRNLWHSCGRFRVADHFTGADPARRETYRALIRLVRAQGPVTVYAQRSRIVCQVRVRFAGIVVRRGWLDVGLWLRRRVDHPTLARIEDVGRPGYGHHFRIRTVTDLDPSLKALIREAYAIGAQASPS